MKKIGIFIWLAVIISGCESEESQFKAAYKSNRLDALSQFIKKYPDGQLAEQAGFILDSAINKKIDSAFALLCLGQHDSAKVKYRSVLEVRPDHPIVLNNLAVQLFKEKSYEEGMELFSLAIRGIYLDSIGSTACVLAAGDTARAVPLFAFQRYEDTLTKYDDTKNRGRFLMTIGNYSPVSLYSARRCNVNPIPATAYTNLSDGSVKEERVFFYEWDEHINPSSAVSESLGVDLLLPEVHRNTGYADLLKNDRGRYSILTVEEFIDTGYVSLSSEKLGFKFKHPSNWAKIGIAELDSVAAPGLLTLPRNPGTKLAGMIFNKVNPEMNIAILTTSTDIDRFDEKSINMYANGFEKTIREQMDNVTVLKSEKITINNLPAYSIIIEREEGWRGVFKQKQIDVIHNRTQVSILFSAPRRLFDIANQECFSKVIESINFASNI